MHEAVFAGADKSERRKCMHKLLPLPANSNFANSCEEGMFVGNQSVQWQKTIVDWARQHSVCSTTVPDEFVRLVSVPESPPIVF